MESVNEEKKVLEQSEKPDIIKLLTSITSTSSTGIVLVIFWLIMESGNQLKNIEHEQQFLKQQMLSIEESIERVRTEQKRDLVDYVNLKCEVLKDRIDNLQEKLKDKNG